MNGAGPPKTLTEILQQMCIFTHECELFAMSAVDDKVFVS